MKKLFIFLLILAMVPVIAIAEEPDPILGSWYMFYDKNETPEIENLFPDYNMIIEIYTFQSDGLIMVTENAIRSATDSNLHHNPIGKWSRTGDEYSYSMIGVGENTCYFKDNELFLTLEQGTGLRLHKLLPLDPYKDYDFKR